MFTRQKAFIVGLVLLLGLSAAACASAPPASSAMTLGAVTAAPDAFVDFCRRQPAECGVSKDEAEAVAAARAPAASPDWSAVFAATDAAPPQERWDVATGATGAGPGQAAVDWAAVFAPSPAPAAPAVDLTRAQTLDAALWAKLNKVNVRINRAIVRASDASAYGVEELWSLPLENGQKYGDCEDYVLEKRLALIAEGIPASALSIAVVRTRWGEGHAVLVVTTDKGEYVLDNQTPWILSWKEAPYQWLARQTAGGAFSWALVAGADLG